MLKDAVSSVFQLMCNRYRANGNEYPFIDMKIDTITGDDFPNKSENLLDIVCNKNSILTWIQGRGLESLVIHYYWLKNNPNLYKKYQTLPNLKTIELMISSIVSKLEEFREANHGKMWFLFDTNGIPFTFENGKRKDISLKNSPYNFSDLFYAKGLMASSILLRNHKKSDEAKCYFRKILKSIKYGQFKSDQISFDPKNIINHTPNKTSQGPMMIAIGACALFAEFTKDDEWFNEGMYLIKKILKHFININDQFPKLSNYDFFEAHDENDNPWIEDNKTLISDPGHSLEFIGLSAKLLLQKLKNDNISESDKQFIDQMRELLPLIFFQNFKNGWNKNIGGIYKSFDLINKTPINSDMPWWALPETMRAATLLQKLTDDSSVINRLNRCYQMCKDAFCENFINKNAHMMAYQTINKEGVPVKVIPATPDADPGYHTGLSLIDIFNDDHEPY